MDEQVEPGQIVSFVYKSQNEKRGYKRTVLLIKSRLRYRKNLLKESRDM